MTYIATPKPVTILGVEFHSYLNEAGEVVFSVNSTARGFGYKGSNGVIARHINAVQLSDQKRLEPSSSNGSDAVQPHTLKVLEAGKTKTIRTVTKTHLSQLVEILAERGNEIAQSMLSAGAATVIQMAVDEAYGVERDRGDYISAANELARQMRQELKGISGKFTNPVLHCNAYAENNLLVYGDGYNRDTYDKEDAHAKHEEEKALELIQAGMKMAGLTMSETIKRSHDLFRLRFRKQTRADIEG